MEKTPFQKWFEEHKEECRHIPTFSGKKARDNLFIIYALSSGNEMSCWELSLEYLKQTVPNFNKLNPDTIYRKRLSVNATLYRSLLTLQLKGYVEKEGTRYRLTTKGRFMILILDPGLVVKSLPEEERDEFNHLLGLDIFRNILKTIFTHWKVNMDEISSDDLFELYRKLLYEVGLGESFDALLRLYEQNKKTSQPEHSSEDKVSQL